VLVTDSGIIKLYFSELPQKVRAKFKYDPERARAYTAADAERQRELYEKTQRERCDCGAEGSRGACRSSETSTRMVAQQNSGLVLKPGKMAAKDYS
jgi:hypothetical protein